MKKKVYMILIILLLIPGISAHDFNFTTRYNLTSFTGTSIDSRIKAYDNSTFWFVTYQLGSASSNNRKIARLDEDFTLLGTDGMSCYTGKECDNSDCNIRRLVDRTVWSCIGSTAEHTGFWHGSIREYNLNTLTSSEISNAVDGNLRVGEEIGVCQDQSMKIWFINGNGENDPYYTDADNIGTDFEGDGTIDLPTTYETPTDLQIVSCGGAYHVILYKNGLFDLIYDWDRDYKDVYSMQPTGYIVGIHDYNVWVDENNQTLYLAMVNNTGGDNDGGLLNLQAWSCDSDYKLSHIFTKEYNQTDIDSTANYTDNKYIRKPFLMKDNHGIFNLFYEWRDGASYNVRVSVDYAECICGSWITQGECSEEYQKFTRTCAPYGCESNLTYWGETSYCGRQFNKTLGIFTQEVFSFSDSAGCDTGFVDPSEHGIIRCDVYLDIPINCSNIEANATTKLITIEQDSIFRTLEENFTYLICNPLTDCDEYTTYTCEDVYHENITLYKGHDGYFAGDLATAGFQVSGSECASSYNFFGNEGWLKYRLIGTLAYTCDRNCGGYFCIREGLVDFSVQQFIDCTYNQSTKTECTFGCSQITGLCFSSMEEREGEAAKESPTNIFYYLDFLFAPDTAAKKLILAILGTVVFGSLAFTFGTPKEVIPVFFMLCGLALTFFVIIGYIPIVLIIIVVFVLGLYFFMKQSGN